jgi:hypothetical protein
MSMPPTMRGELLTPVQHWTWLAKFWICHGLSHRVITAEDVTRAHRIGDEELAKWMRIYREDGANGFRRSAPNPRRYVA